MTFALWGRKQLVEDAQAGGPGTGFANVALAQNVRSKGEVVRVLAEAEKAGARILEDGSVKLPA